MSITPLKLISSMAARDMLVELIRQYSQAGSQAIDMQAAGGLDVAKRIQAGEATDIVVLSAAAIDQLIAAGKLLAGSRVDLVKSGVAIAVRQGARRFAIGDEAAVKHAVLAAASVSYSTGPSGVYLERLFERWGILPDIKGKIIVPPPGVPVGSLVARGECELGFQQLSELMNLPGIDVLGSLPPDIQTITVFSGGLSAHSSQPEAARQVLQFMASQATAETKRRYGMEPA